MILLLAAILLLMLQAGEGPGWLLRQALVTVPALVLLAAAVVVQPKNKED
ncbi:MAG TPA: hypothetical protein VLH56_18165 [Dissulfurispiraceae bacterium]|nr:hypothetical protein [Dissulfurispiraceae bacterium]